MVLRTMNCPTLLVFIRDSCVSPSSCASANSLYISVRMRKQALYFCAHAQTGPIFLGARANRPYIAGRTRKQTPYFCAHVNRPYISVRMCKQALYFCEHVQTGPIFLCACANRPYISVRMRKQALYFQLRLRRSWKN